MSICYHLSLKGCSSIVIERCGVACAASGKAGGFLAKNWGGDGAFGKLCATSFDMHAALAELPAFKGKTDYRRVVTLSVSEGNGRLKTGRRAANSEKSGCPNWVDCADVLSAMGDEASTAQVHPKKLSDAFFAAAAAPTAQGLPGASLREGIVDGLVYAPGDAESLQTGVRKRKVCGVRLAGGEEILGSAVVLAMGPWSAQACKWLPQLPRVSSQRAHSIVLRPGVAAEAHTPPTAHCLFVDCDDDVEVGGLSRE